MVMHWTNFELSVRDLINEPPTGAITQARLVRWANEAMRKLPYEVQLSKARIVISIGANVVAIVEEDWPGTEAVGTPAYTYGRDGTFYIQYAEKIDSIRQLLDAGEEDDCGLYVEDWKHGEPLLYKTRQEHIIGQIPDGDSPVYYGVYRFFVYVDKVDDCGLPAPDPPRPGIPPLEVLSVWFEPMFDPAAVDECGTHTYKYWEIQYRRRPPEIDLEELCLEYTQPYFYIPEVCEDLIEKYVCMQALFAIGDIRYKTVRAEYVLMLRNMKHNLADRDRTPVRLVIPDDVHNPHPAALVTRAPYRLLSPVKDRPVNDVSPPVAFPMLDRTVRTFFEPAVRQLIRHILRSDTGRCENYTKPNKQHYKILTRFHYHSRRPSSGLLRYPTRINRQIQVSRSIRERGKPANPCRPKTMSANADATSCPHIYKNSPAT